MLLQGRVASDQVNGRRHDSPIRRRRYRTRLHKCIGILISGPAIENQSVESAEAAGGNSSSTRWDRRRNSPGTSFDVYTVLPALWITTPDVRAVFASISRITGCAIRTRPASRAASNVALKWTILRSEGRRPASIRRWLSSSVVGEYRTSRIPSVGRSRYSTFGWP